MRALLVFLLLSSASIFAFRALPSGYSELGKPKTSFISPGEYLVIQEQRLPVKVDGISQYNQVMSQIAEQNYQQAEKQLSAQSSKPENALNLAFLYHYLDEGESAKKMFIAWQKAVTRDTQINLLLFLYHKPMNRALDFVVATVTESETKLFALYLVAKKNRNVRAVKAQLVDWLKRDVSSRHILQQFLAMRLNSKYSRIKENHFKLIENRAFRELVKGLHYKERQQLQRTFELWYGLLQGGQGQVRFSRDVYSRLIVLMIKLRHYKALEDYIENPPIFLQASVPKIRKIIEKNKQRLSQGSNVVKIKLVEPQVPQIDLEKKTEPDS